MMRLRPVHLPTDALAALLGAGCGGSGDSGTPVATSDVAMAKSYRFDPKVIEIEAGQTVTWHNGDNFTHTVQVDGQADHEVERDGSVSIAFPRPARTTTSAGSTVTTWMAR